MTETTTDAHLTQPPAAKAEMLVRRPVTEVFAAFVDPAITSKFWFTKGSGRFEPGARVRWEWEMYGVSADVDVLEVEPERRILVSWPGEHGPTTIEWRFTPLEDGTFVSIVNSGFGGDADQMVNEAVGSTEGFTLVLAGLKAFLEHGVRLNLVADRFPAGLAE